MINNCVLKELDDIVNRINNNSVSLEELNALSEDAEFLLKILNSVNKSNLKKFKLKDNSSNNASISYDDVSYTSDNVHEIFSSFTIEEIENKYTMKQLKEMYFSVCGVKPMSSLKNKKDIIQSIVSWFSSIERNKSLANL